MSEPIEGATYSPEDDKLRIYSGRVSEKLYARLKKLGFGRAYKQGCFYAAWTPQREDVVLELCGQIDDEDSTIADRAETKAERLTGYSENAGKRAQARAKASSDAVKGIPFGQPILRGHHSEKRHLAALAKAQRNATKSVKEFKRSGYWAERAENVLSHAGRKHQPGTISRRIKRLEAEARKQERRIDPDGADWAKDVQWLKRGSEDKGVQEIAAIWEQRVVYCTRWIEHLRGQVAFWQTILEDAGGVPADEWADEFEVGGWVRGQYGWGQIERINKAGGRINSVSLDRATFTVPYMIRIIKYERIREYRSDEEYQEMAGKTLEEIK